MNIIVSEQSVENISSKYLVLELDTFVISPDGNKVISYALIENIPLDDVYKLNEVRELHQNLIKNYKLKHWDYCEQAINHLMGKWQGELDTFYIDLLDRIKKHRYQSLPLAWDGSVIKIC